MRTHERAAELVGQRSCAASGADTNDDRRGRLEIAPKIFARRLLGDLVPLGELDAVLEGLAAATVNLFESLEEGERLLDNAEEEDRIALRQGTVFCAFSQELAYALLMADAPAELAS